MDSVSGGESIRALIQLQMELFSNGQTLISHLVFFKCFFSLYFTYCSLFLTFFPQTLLFKHTPAVFRMTDMTDNGCKLSNVFGVSTYKKALLQVSLFVVEIKRKWLHLCCYSASSLDT